MTAGSIQIPASAQTAPPEPVNQGTTSAPVTSDGGAIIGASVEIDAPQPQLSYGTHYVRPTEATKIRNYAFDAFGPYPLVVSAVVAGLNQSSNTPPEWGQGAEGFGDRMASSFGIALTTTTTRYALAKLMREDTLYYRSDKAGILPRTEHAVISAFTGRRGPEGRRVFSIPALVAPYAGAFTAIYGWYPDRFGAKDAARLGSYNLLIYVGGNLALEFLYSGPHTLLSRMHLQSAHVAPDSGLK